MHPGAIDLLLADLVMPGMGGQTLAEQVLVLRPGIGILFMSGYTNRSAVQFGRGSGNGVLQKPFLPAELARKVRERLDLRAEQHDPSATC